MSSITIISDAPNCSVTYDRHYDDRNSFIIQATDYNKRVDVQNKSMEQPALKNVNNCLNTNIYSYLETSGVQSYNLYLNVVHFFNASVN